MRQGSFHLKFVEAGGLLCEQLSSYLIISKLSQFPFIYLRSLLSLPRDSPRHSSNVIMLSYSYKILTISPSVPLRFSATGEGPS